MIKPGQPRPLTDTEKLARRKRIARVAKRRGLVDIEDSNDEGPVAAIDDDDDVSIG